MMEWIGVEGRKPEYGEPVLVYYAGDGIEPPRVYISWWVYNLGFLLERVYGSVTHWMPLPEPPKEE